MSRTLKLLLLAIACCSTLAGMAARAVAADSVVYAAGDIACDPLDPNFNGGGGTATACRQTATANLMVGSFDAVLALGDLQYEAGSLSNFRQSYARSWGRVKAKTLPVIGNHEGIAATAGAGYCAYFGAAAHCNASRRQGGAAFYSFDVGDWHVVVLNSNCVAAGGCDVGSPQYQWLQNDLAGNPRACTLAAWHHPRWSSGAYGSNAFMQPIWQLLWANGADLVLSGHSHDYERFAPMDAAGTANAPEGIRSFVVGTGGAYFTGIGAPAPGSEVHQNTSFGVLRLVLHPTSYDWNFIPASGSTFTDAGSQACHGPPDLQAPGPPGTLTAMPRRPTRVNLSWAGSTDNVGVAGYEIWRGSGKAGALAPLVATSGADTASVDTTVAAGQGYRYQVQARDWAGNWSAMSNVCTVVTPAVAGAALHSHGTLLARWRLKPARARRVLARGRIRIPARPWAPTVIRTRVGGRLAAIRRVRVTHAVTMRLASWCKRHRYRDRWITVTIRRAS